MFPFQKAILCLYLDALSVPYISEMFEEAGIRSLKKLSLPPDKKIKRILTLFISAVHKYCLWLQVLLFLCSKLTT